MSETKEISATDQAILALLDTFKAGKDFVLEQAPDVIQQFLQWHFWSAVAACVFAFAITVTFAVFTRWSWNKGWMHVDSFGDKDVGPQIVGYIVVGVILSLVCPVVFISNFMQALQVWIAPKVYLLTYAAELVK